MDDKKEAAPEKEAEEKEEGKEGGAEGEGAEGDAAAGGSKKKKLIIIIAAAVFLLGAVGAGAFFMLSHGSSDSEGEGEEEEQEIQYVVDEHGNKVAIDPNQVAYVDLDEFLVNLNSSGKQNSFLKMTVTLELPSLKEKRNIESNIPRIRDTFQIYLRELRASDLQGSAGIHRLREELLLRINKVIHPDKVTDILFKEIIVQ